MSNPKTIQSMPAAETSSNESPHETHYSGEALLKMPKSLHRKLAESAEQEGVDLNQYLVSLLTEHSIIGSVQGKLEDLNRQIARRESLNYSRERTTPYNRYVEDIELGIND